MAPRSVVVITPSIIKGLGNILFALQEPGYLRFYGPAIVELERRGWNVAIVYSKPEKRGPDFVLPPNAGDRVRSLGAVTWSASSSATTLRTTLDAFRYLDPAYASAEYLRRRAEKELRPPFEFIKRLRRVPRWVVTAAIAAGRAIERLIPVDPEALSFVRNVNPDLVVVSPLVIVGRQGANATELVKAAKALRIPCAVAVASWDHLTSKGLVRVVPDAVIVWNDIQADEAVRLHRIPPRRIALTGAQSLDRWFDRPSDDALRAFRRQRGIADGQRVLLWVASSTNMAPGDSEPQLVRRWLAALRASTSPELRRAFVIVRPHPGNVAPWDNVDFRDAGAVVWPTSYASGVLFSDADVDEFRYSMLASSAVVGINTTAMIEAAIVRRPVFSVRDAAFTHSQEQTLHFGYLVNGGCATVAHTLPEHIAQLERVVSVGEPDMSAADRFVARFVRPLGMATSATICLCDALERIAASRDAAHASAAAMPAGPSDAVSGRA